MVTIKKIAPLSLAKIQGVVYALLGLLYGFLTAMFAVIGAAFADSPESGLLGVVLGVGAIVLFPLGLGLMGFVAGLVMALVYNVLARLVGGIEVELQP